MAVKKASDHSDVDNKSCHIYLYSTLDSGLFKASSFTVLNRNIITFNKNFIFYNDPALQCVHVFTCPNLTLTEQKI